jgi:hypothetical protein
VLTIFQDTLYIILVARGQVITLVRPKKHSIHPTGSRPPIYFALRNTDFVSTDIHIIVNTIHTPSIFNSPAAASWIPVCLPKFNAAGFVNAYISFLRKPERREADASNRDSDVLEDGPDHAGERTDDASRRGAPWDASIGLVCISGGGEFETVRGWCDTVAEVRRFVSQI